MTNTNDPRQRLYQSYVSSGAAGPTASDEAALLPRFPYLNSIVRKHFPAARDSTIIDLGCGHGALLHAAHRAGYTQLAGVDGSREQVEAAHRLGLSNVSHGDLFEFLKRHASNSIDAVIAFDVLEHLTKTELLRMVDEVRRVLRPGGRWIVHVPNGESPFFGRIRYGDFTHEMAFTQNSISTLLKSSGFTDVECHEDRPVAHGFKSTLRLCLWHGIRALLKFYLAVETGSASGAIFSQNFLCVAWKRDAQ